MSRTVRYFKLIYIVAGILLSNEKICETVDQIEITPRFTKTTKMAKPLEFRENFNHHAVKAVAHNHREISVKKSTFTNSWYGKLYVFQLLTRMKGRLRTPWRIFSIWTLLNLLVECCTSRLCRTFIINSDCDVIYK